MSRQAVGTTMVVFVVAAIWPMLGCHHGDGHFLHGGNAHVEGTWDASILHDSGREERAVITLDQSHPFDWEVIGVFSSPEQTGEVSGIVDGAIVDVRIRLYRPCDERIRLRATVFRDDREMTGSLDGTDCRGTLDATFTATRR